MATANVIINKVTYSDVPSVNLPKSGGGTAEFVLSESYATIFSGSSDPAAGLGSDGDIYLKVT